MKRRLVAGGGVVEELHVIESKACLAEVWEPAPAAERE
jgi:hypothetical protein